MRSNNIQNGNVYMKNCGLSTNTDVISMNNFKNITKQISILP